MQHLTSLVPGVNREINTIQPVPSASKVSRKGAQLPAHFREVPRAVLRVSEPYAPQTGGRIKSYPFVSGHEYKRERD